MTLGKRTFVKLLICSIEEKCSTLSVKIFTVSFVSNFFHIPLILTLISPIFPSSPSISLFYSSILPLINLNYLLFHSLYSLCASSFFNYTLSNSSILSPISLTSLSFTINFYLVTSSNEFTYIFSCVTVVLVA